MLLTVTGFLGCDVEEKHTKAGNPYRRFVIGVSDRKNRDEETQWVECQMWDNRFAGMFPYLFKGTLVMVVGRLQVSSYLSKLQEPKTQLRVNVESLNFLPQTKRPDRVSFIQEAETPALQMPSSSIGKESPAQEESLWEGEGDMGVPIF